MLERQLCCHGNIYQMPIHYWGTYRIKRCYSRVWYTGNAECDVYLQTAHLAKRHQLKSRPYHGLRRDDGLPLKSYSRGLE